MIKKSGVATESSAHRGQDRRSVSSDFATLLKDPQQAPGSTGLHIGI